MKSKEECSWKVLDCQSHSLFVTSAQTSIGAATMARGGYGLRGAGAKMQSATPYKARVVGVTSLRSHVNPA